MKVFSFSTNSFLFIFRSAGKLVRAIVVLLGLLLALLAVFSPLIFVHKQLTLSAPKLMGFTVQPAIVYALSACTTSGGKPRIYKQTVFVKINEIQHSVDGQPCNLANEGETLQAITKMQDGHIVIRGFAEGAWSFDNVFMLLVSIVVMPIIGILLGWYMLTMADRHLLKKTKPEDNEEDSDSSF